MSGNCVWESFKTPTLPCRVDCEDWVCPSRVVACYKKVISDDQTSMMEGLVGVVCVIRECFAFEAMHGSGVCGLGVAG